MKNLVKKHMIGLFALVLTVATMSFKVAEHHSLSTTWFSVGSGGSIGDQISPSECQGSATLCAVEFNNSDLVGANPPISNVNDDDPNSPYIHGSRYKN